MKGDPTPEEASVLREMAERIVKIPPGEKFGRWTREDRVAVVFAVLCAFWRKESKS